MKEVQKWEMAGVPAAIVFEALYQVGVLQKLGLSAEDTPHVMVIAFVLMAIARAAADYMRKRKE